MKFLTNFIGGLAGAATLTILNETFKRFDPEAPRLDCVGEEGMNKLMEKAGADPLEGDALYVATLTGDLLSNAVYYSLIGKGKRKFLLARGILYGLGAGIGNLEVARRMNIDDAPLTRSEKTRFMTVGYYLVGGIMTALAIKALTRSIEQV
jgi:hypothetical protein